MGEGPIVTAVSESSETSAVTVSTVSPMPTDDEVVAIVAAAEALWPVPLAVVDTAPPRHATWRFSGRWWSRPVPARRDRPFR
jgi:hypothetical protein